MTKQCFDFPDFWKGVLAIHALDLWLQQVKQGRKRVKTEHEQI